MGAEQYAGVARVGPTWRSGCDHSTEGWSARIKSALPDLKPAAGAITWYWPPEHCAPGRPRDEARAMCTAATGTVSIVKAPVTAQATKSAPARLLRGALRE